MDRGIRKDLGIQRGTEIVRKKGKKYSIETGGEFDGAQCKLHASVQTYDDLLDQACPGERTSNFL